MERFVSASAEGEVYKVTVTWLDTIETMWNWGSL